MEWFENGDELVGEWKWTCLRMGMGRNRSVDLQLGEIAVWQVSGEGTAWCVTLKVVSQKSNHVDTGIDE